MYHHGVLVASKGEPSTRKKEKAMKMGKDKGIKVFLDSDKLTNIHRILDSSHKINFEITRDKGKHGYETLIFKKNTIQRVLKAIENCYVRIVVSAEYIW
jgi:repressor of nif and glnA expression